MAALLKSSVFLGSSKFMRQALKPATVSTSTHQSAHLVVRVGPYDEELIKTANSIAYKARAILAMDESNATCGKRLASIGLENTKANHQAYRELLVTTHGIGLYIFGAIWFEETLYQSTVAGKKFVDCLQEADIAPGIKVDKGLVPLARSNDESSCQGLDSLASKSAEYYKQGTRFAKWRTVVSIPNGPSRLAAVEAAWGLARYAKISHEHGIVPIVELAEQEWKEGILLKPSMVTPGAECKERANPEVVAE
ncbi:hypothetical protein KP509_08G025800 [Ceratopteris richardii]|uniref:fructose-bisphosphate aldolase n=1 Tax=Ceratopteris richardii TaxID=49495 RepID=A0A8T2UAW9_CERRI|nr:hypothetical protein KP509_08G025800 [Ceratopteris richardii]